MYTANQQSAINIIYNAIDVANKKFNLKLKYPIVEFSNRMTSCAGRAWYTKNKIRLSTPLLDTNGEAFLARTPVHEVAHIVAYKKFGKKGIGHNKYFYHVCEELGMENPTRCHSYRLPTTVKAKAKKRRKHVRYVFSCGCRDSIKLSAQKKNKYDQFICGQCRSQLKPVLDKDLNIKKVTYNYEASKWI